MTLDAAPLKNNMTYISCATARRPRFDAGGTIGASST
jgi:hypothetical protein